MSLTKSPPSNFGSGSNLRAVMTTGVAALIGTVVGGVSVLGIVVAVTPPQNHEIRSDARDGSAMAPPPVQTATPPAQAATPPPQTAPVAQSQSVPPVEGPRTVWPDALSARANHNAETATETPAPQQDSSPANDRAAISQNDGYGAGRDPTPANNSAVTSRDSLPDQISPNTAPAKKRVVVSPPGQSTERTVDEVPAGNAPKARSETRNSQSPARRSQRSPDGADQPGNGQAAAVSPPQRRVIILPNPDQAANDDRGHWGGGLFDFFGQNHSDGDHWNQDHWNSDWHGSSDWRN